MAHRFEGLTDEPRPGAPRTVTDDDVERVVVKTLTAKPKNATHWSSRDMAKATGMSQSTVSRIWRAFGLKPWRTDTFKLSEDPMFIEKVRDIVDLYLNPPERAVVLCVDEKSQVQALDRTQHSCRCGPARLSATPMTTFAMASLAFLPRSTSLPERDPRDPSPA